MKTKSLSHVRLSATPETAAHQAPPSMGFSRQEYWSGVPLPSPNLLLDAPNLFSQAKLPDLPTTPFITRFEIFLELSRCHDVLKPAHSLHRPSLSPAPTKPTHAQGLSCPYPALDGKDQDVSQGNLGNASQVVGKLRSHPPSSALPRSFGGGARVLGASCRQSRLQHMRGTNLSFSPEGL